MAEKVSMDIPLQPGPTSNLFDDLIGPLLGNVTTLPRAEQIVTPVQIDFLSIEQYFTNQAILEIDDTLY